jgi:hypothetical protein
MSLKVSGNHLVQVPNRAFKRRLNFYSKSGTAETMITLPKQLIPFVEAEFEGDTFEEKLKKFNQRIDQGGITIDYPFLEPLLNVVANRIPTSGLQLVENFRIAEFLHPKGGKMIVVPNGITVKAGSDFDIDKLATYYGNIIFDPATKTAFNMNIKTDIFSTKVTDAQLDVFYKAETIRVKNMREDLGTDKPISRYELETIYNELAESGIFSVDSAKGIRNILSMTNGLDVIPDDLKEELRSLLKTNASGYKVLNSGKKIVEVLPTPILENVLMDNMKWFINHEDNFQNLIKPLEKTLVSDVIGEEESGADLNSLFNLLKNVDMTRANSELGIDALNTSVVGTLESLDHYLPTGIPSISDPGNTITLGNTLTNYNGKSERVAEILNQVMQMHLEAAKDDVAERSKLYGLTNKMVQNLLVLYGDKVDFVDLLKWVSSDNMKKFLNKLEISNSMLEREEKGRNTSVAEVIKTHFGIKEAPHIEEEEFNEIAQGAGLFDIDLSKISEIGDRQMGALLLYLNSVSRPLSEIAGEVYMDNKFPSGYNDLDDLMLSRDNKRDNPFIDMDAIDELHSVSRNKALMDTREMIHKMLSKMKFRGIPGVREALFNGMLKDSFQRSDKNSSVIEDMMIQYILQESGTVDPTLLRQPDRIKNILSIKNQELARKPSHPFWSAIEYIEGKKYKGYKTDSKVITFDLVVKPDNIPQLNRVHSYVLNQYLNGTDQMKQAITDLLQISLIKNGFRYSGNNFTRLFPPDMVIDFIQGPIRKKFEEVRSDEGIREEFIKDVILGIISQKKLLDMPDTLKAVKMEQVGERYLTNQSYGRPFVKGFKESDKVFKLVVKDGVSSTMTDKRGRPIYEYEPMDVVGDNEQLDFTNKEIATELEVPEGPIEFQQSERTIEDLPDWMEYINGIRIEGKSLRETMKKRGLDKEQRNKILATLKIEYENLNRPLTEEELNRIIDC